MTDQTQKQWVIEQLRKKGYITRNECLGEYITRLGAIIANLKKDGYKFKKGEYSPTAGKGKDYIYRLINNPIERVPDETLDEKLERVLKSLTVDWDNMDEINKVNNAIKSNNKYLKESILREYS